MIRKPIGCYLYYMRVVIQRVTEASITVDELTVASIKNGLLILLGIEGADTTDDIMWLSNKIINLRIFNDLMKVPNLSLKEIDGDILLVSQFTLHADTKKGNRPSYLRASKSIIAIPLYQKMIAQLEKDLGRKISTGVFGADMQVALINDGPITIWIDSKQKSAL